MPPGVAGTWYADLPWWLAGLFLVLLLYRASPRIGGVLLVILALGALVVLAGREQVGLPVSLRGGLLA